MMSEISIYIGPYKFDIKYEMYDTIQELVLYTFMQMQITSILNHVGNEFKCWDEAITRFIVIQNQNITLSSRLCC